MKDVEQMDEFDKKEVVRDIKNHVMFIALIMFLVGMFTYGVFSVTRVDDLIVHFILITFYLIGTVQLKNDICKIVKRIIKL